MYNNKKKMNLRGRKGPKVMLNAVLMSEVLKNKIIKKINFLLLYNKNGRNWEKWHIYLEVINSPGSCY